MATTAVAGPAPALVTVDTDKVLVEVRAQASALKLRAEQAVVTRKTRDEVAGFLVEVNQLKKRAEDRRKSIVDPHTKWTKRVNDFVRDILAPVVEADTILRGKLRDFIRREEAEQAEAEAEARRAQLRAEALVGQAAAAEAAGERGAGQLLEEAVGAEQHAQQLQTFVAAGGAIERSVRPSTGGLVGARKVWTFELLDIAQVPEEYLKPREIDAVKVRAAIAAGVRDVEGRPGIPGLRIFEDDQLQVRG